MLTSFSPWAGLAAFATRIDLWSIITTLGGPLQAAQAPGGAWLAAGLPLALISRLSAAAVETGGDVIVPTAPDWPSALTAQPFAPVLFGAEGDTSLLLRPAVAIVGARASTPYGLQHARSLASAVAAAGGVVVSGLARGIDREAHLAAPGATIAVLGQGLHSPMPSWQMALRRRLLADGGLILSEFPSAMSADIWTFPVRNRVVAGLARAVVVVEAGHRSGAKNTASHALRLGREVLAVPGPLNAPASAGSLDLIEEGAEMVRGPQTVLRAARLRAAPSGTQKSRPEGPSERVMAALGSGATVDGLMEATGLSHAEISAVLVMLGLAGRISRLPGNRYLPRGR